MYPNVYHYGYTLLVLIETLSVREARVGLPGLLARFRAGDRTPVGVGSHRKTEAVVVPIELFTELLALRDRTRAADTAIASLNAEHLIPSPAAVEVLAAWRDGRMSTGDALTAIEEAHHVR